MRSFAVTSALLLIAIATPARAQSLAEATASTEVASHHLYSPFALMTTAAALSRQWSVTGFYIVWTGQGPERRPHFVARQTTGRWEEGTPVVWADSRECPELLEVLEDMERLPPVWLDVPGLGRADDRLGLVLDGVGHTLRHRSARNEDGTMSSIEISGNVDTPLAAWWSGAKTRLASCWGPIEPAL